MNKEQQICCATCGTTSHLMRCGKCKMIYYCSSAHQHIDWPMHKRECRVLAQKKVHLKMQNIQKTSQISNNTNEFTNYGITDNSNKYSVILSSEEMIHPIVENYVNLNDNDQNILSIDHKLSTQSNSILMEHHLQLDNPIPEKNSSFEIGYADENSYDYTNERRYEELCRHIIDDMNQYGLSVVDDFLGMEKGLQILNEVHRMYAAGVFQDGQLVNDVGTDRESRTIRGDKITWVKGIEQGCASVGYLINQIDAVVCRANSMKNNGKLGNYNIKERTKAMIACYPGSGSHYVMHVDNPNKDGRVITAIYYLNVNWDTKRSGGVLRIFPEFGNTIADIEPKFDRLIFFWSDKRNPHEVQPAHRTRYAITVWYFDANEREIALNRCKFTNKTPLSNITEFKQQGASNNRNLEKDVTINNQNSFKCSTNSDLSGMRT